ncbi:MAG: tetratricopeptide repeat protein [Porticoccaceae bacterium]
MSASLGLFPERTLAFEFQDLWLTKDQQAARALAEGDAVKAEQLFENQQWKGVAAYKNNNFSDAETLFDGNDADSHFNRGNALAKQGKLREAITAYEQALKLDPEMRDALDNIQAVKEEMKKQKEKEQQRNKENNQENNQAHSSAENQEGNQGQKNQSQDQGTRQEQEGNSQTSPEQTQDQQQSGNQSSQQTQQSSNSRNASGQQREQEQEQEKNTGQQPDKNRQSETPQDVPSGQSEGQQQEKQPNESANQSVPEELSDEEEQAVEQWLRRIPDDPGGLLRRKFEAEAQKRREQRRWGSMPPQDKQLQRW